VLLLVGAGFLLAYILTGRNLGFLVPGCIVLSIGIFAYLNENKILPSDGGQIFLLFLAAAFWTIMLIHTMWIKNGDFGEKFWPIFPAIPLTVLGIIAMSDSYPSLRFLETTGR
jgi:hypothetical protein